MVTPSEYLVLEVLAARFRLGESIWPFPSAFKATALSLKEKELVEVLTGPIPQTMNLSLTGLGQALLLSDKYARAQ